VSEESSKATRVKDKILHELREVLVVSLFLGLFFFAFATYKMLLLHQFRSAQFIYLTALINTMVLAKVVLLGDFVPQGKVMEHRKLIISAVYKAAFFALLVAVFHFVEELVKDLIHNHSLADALRETVSDTWIQLAGLTIICFCLFIPFFCLWEIRRVMGKSQFYSLFVQRRDPVIKLSE
jgi:hypothetical protein